MRIQEHMVEGAQGCGLSVRETGNPMGPAMLWIHGWMFSQEVFRQLAVTGLAETYRIISFDLRGHGRSESPSSIEVYAEPQHWADDVAAVVAAMNIERALFLGWSLGSRVAVHYASRYGFEHVAGFNLITTVVAKSVNHVQPSGQKDGLQNLLSDDLRDREEATRHFVATCCPSAVGTPLFDEFLADAMLVSPTARRGAMVWHQRYEDFLPTIPVPVLVTHGAQDSLVDIAASQALVSAVPKAQLSVIDGAGHLPFVEQSRRFEDELRDFARDCFTGTML